MSDTTPAVAPAAPSTTTTAAEGGAPLASLQQGAPPEAAAPKDKGATLTGEPAWKKQINDLVERAEKARADKEAKAAPPEPEGLKEGESWDSIYASQPPEVQRAMAEMRKMVTRKTQELAAEKKAIEAQRKALVAPEIAKALEAPAVAGEVDPFDPKSLSAHIEAEVKRRLAEVLEPVRKQSQQAEAQQRYESFMAEHPDLSADKALRTEVAALLKQNAALDLSTAYYAVKGRRSRAAEAEAAKRVALESRAAQRAALNVSTGPRVAGGRVEPSIDPKASAWEIYQTLAKARSV
jgi:hypothetical protein